jgi:integrase
MSQISKTQQSLSDGKDSTEGLEAKNSAKVRHLSKTDVRYWRGKLFKRTGPDKRPGPDWHVQIGFAGHQDKFPLRTPNKDAAAKLALEIYDFFRGGGTWEDARSKFKPWTNTFEKIQSPTVGEFISAIEAHSRINPITLKSYTRKFRRLVAGVKAIKSGAEKFDRLAGAAKYRLAVDSVKLADLKPAAIQKWKSTFTTAQRGNPKLQARAETTAQSIIRNAKSLFSAKVMKDLRSASVELSLPSPLPFDGVEIGRRVNHRYTSTIDAEALASAAHGDLARAEPEQFKIFLLAFAVGLRRGEIDRLAWSQFNWSKGQINVEVTAHGDTKTDSSIAPVDVDPAVMEIFAKFKKSASGEFVVESTVAPRPGVNWHHYRCACTFRRLNGWLRGKGVDTPNPIHTLRKEFGTLICQRFGIFAAAEALRHSDIRLTRAHYTDRRGRIHLEVGKMFGGHNG